MKANDLIIYNIRFQAPSPAVMPADKVGSPFFACKSIRFMETVPFANEKSGLLIRPPVQAPARLILQETNGRKEKLAFRFSHRRPFPAQWKRRGGAGFRAFLRSPALPLLPVPR